MKLYKIIYDDTAKMLHSCNGCIGRVFGEPNENMFGHKRQSVKIIKCVDKTCAFKCCNRIAVKGLHLIRLSKIEELMYEKTI